MNTLRTDIQQRAAGDNLPGSAVYINLSGIGDVDDAISEAGRIVRDNFGWSDDGGDAKILFLTHRLIARRAGYEELWRTYHGRGAFYRDRFQSGEDEIARYFCDKCEPLIEAWRSQRAGKAISMLDGKMNAISGVDGKKRVSTALNRLVEICDGNVTIAEVLIHLRKTGLIPLLDDLEFWIKQLPSYDIEGADDDERERAFADSGSFDRRF